MDSCPVELKAYEKSCILEKNREDIKNWELGQYLLSAIASAFCKSEKYPKKPMFQREMVLNDNEYKESREEAAVFEMKQRIKLLRKQGLPESPM